jgi:hypothetical protein
VPAGHMLRAVDRFVILMACGGIWRHSTVRPAVHRSIRTC